MNLFFSCPLSAYELLWILSSSMYFILQGLEEGPATACVSRNYILASKCTGAPGPLQCCAHFMSPAMCDMQFPILVSGTVTGMSAIINCSCVLSSK